MHNCIIVDFWYLAPVNMYEPPVEGVLSPLGAVIQESNPTTSYPIFSYFGPRLQAYPYNTRKGKYSSNYRGYSFFVGSIGRLMRYYQLEQLFFSSKRIYQVLLRDNYRFLIYTSFILSTPTYFIFSFRVYIQQL